MKRIVAITGAGISAESGIKLSAMKMVYGKIIALKTLQLPKLAKRL
jgi:NAD-dependent SIR2 family protein deacetylase